MTTAQGYFDWGECSPSSAVLQSARSFFDEQGYVVLKSFSSTAETASLRTRAAEIIAAFRASTASASIFTTDEQTRWMDPAYFLRSASTVSCFLEAGGARDEGAAERPAAVNKIGHALHDLDAVFGAFSRSVDARRVASALGVRRPALVQSMYIVKGARVGGCVGPHRDRTFVRGEDGGCLGFWWALQDADEENACLWAVPGSHRDGRVVRRMVRDEGTALSFEGDEDDEADDYAEDEYVALPVSEGDLVMLHGGVVHKSEENRSGRSRHAYSIHVVEDGVEERCWLSRPESLPFRPL